MTGARTDIISLLDGRGLLGRRAWIRYWIYNKKMGRVKVKLAPTNNLRTTQGITLDYGEGKAGATRHALYVEALARPSPLSCGRTRKVAHGSSTSPGDGRGKQDLHIGAAAFEQGAVVVCVCVVHKALGAQGSGWRRTGQAA